MSRSQDGLTLQINSLGALERLLGGNEQLNVEVRQSVASQFSEKYLNSIVERQLTSRVNELQRIVTAHMDAYASEQGRSPWLAPELSKAIKKQISDAAILAVEKAVGDDIRAAVEKATASFNERLTRAFEEQTKALVERVNQRLDHNFNKRVDDAVTQRLSQLREALPVTPDNRKITIG